MVFKVKESGSNLSDQTPNGYGSLLERNNKSSRKEIIYNFQKCLNFVSEYLLDIGDTLLSRRTINLGNQIICIIRVDNFEINSYKKKQSIGSYVLKYFDLNNFNNGNFYIQCPQKTHVFSNGNLYSKCNDGDDLILSFDTINLLSKNLDGKNYNLINLCNKIFEGSISGMDINIDIENINVDKYEYTSTINSSKSITYLNSTTYNNLKPGIKNKYAKINK